MTTLASPLTPGDMTVTLTNSAGWNESAASAWARGLIIFGYKSSLGYDYSHYSRIVQADLFEIGQVNKTTYIVALNKPLPSAMGNPEDANGTWATGTSIANASSGATRKYGFFSGLYVPQTDTWYATQNHVGGIDKSGTNVTSNFPPGTVFVKPFWLANLSNRVGGWSGHPDTGTGHRVWFAGVSVMSEPSAAMQEVTTGAAAGSVEIKVPVSDFAAGTVNLAPAALNVTET